MIGFSSGTIKAHPPQLIHAHCANMLLHHIMSRMNRISYAFYLGTILHGTPAGTPMKRQATRLGDSGVSPRMSRRLAFGDA